MGAWGGGLYESDFACDVRADFNGFVRAPLSDDEFLARIEEAHGLGHDGKHVDGFDYWLVLADQLERIGMHRPEIFAHALEIIERGDDITALKALGAKPPTVERRRKDTAKLMERLRNPRPAKTRRPLKSPQPLLFEVGDVLVWPTDRGNPFSDFMPGNRFEQDGWGLAVIKGSGHEYGVYAYYVAQVLMWRRAGRPTLDDVAHCRRSAHYRGAFSKHSIAYHRVEMLGKVSPEALGPLPRPENIYSSGIPLGLDAFNRFYEPKFPLPAPSGTPIDPDEPDQRPGFEEFVEDLDRQRKEKP